MNMSRVNVQQEKVYHKDIIDSNLLDDIIESQFYDWVNQKQNRKLSNEPLYWEHKLVRRKVLESKVIHSLVNKEMGQDTRLLIV